MEAWFAVQACDGFVLAATHMPGAYEDFVRLVVPELQRRALFQTEYAGRTLRDNLGLPLMSRRLHDVAMAPCREGRYRLGIGRVLRDRFHLFAV